MNLKNEILEKEKQIKELLSEFSKVKRDADTIKKNNSKQSEKVMKVLKQLESKGVELSNKITKSKEELKQLYAQFRAQEYNLRTEAKIISEKNSIYVQGDPSKTNLAERVIEIKKSGVNEVRRLLEYDDVEKYYEIFNNLVSYENFSQLPKATPELLKELDSFNGDYNIPPFTYFVVNDRVAVDRDFLSSRLSNLAQMAGVLYGEIDKNNEKLKEYKPNFWQKLHKKNEQKQREALENEVKASNEEKKKKIDEMKVEVDRYTELVKKVVEPSTGIMESVYDIKALLQKNAKLEGYVKKIDTYKNGLKNNTFLRDVGYNDMTQIIPQNVVNFLNANKLKISKENLVKVLSENRLFKDIALEIDNAVSNNSNEIEKTL